MSERKHARSRGYNPARLFPTLTGASWRESIRMGRSERNEVREKIRLAAARLEGPACDTEVRHARANHPSAPSVEASPE